MKLVLNKYQKITLSLVIPFVSLTIFSFILQLFKFFVVYPWDFIVGVSVINLCSVLGFLFFDFISFKKKILIGLLYFPGMIYCLYNYFVVFVCFVFSDCP